MNNKIEKENKIDSNNIQIDNKLYSADLLSSTHPGGDLFVKAFAGRDATEAFLSYHRKKFPHEKLESFVVGESKAIKSPDADKDYLELCALVDQVLPRQKNFAPPTYFLKAFSIIVLAVGLEFYIHYTHQYVWYLTAPLGLLFAFIGLNIQHDANHGAISKSPTVNRLFGLTQNWIGGSAVDWIHQHVVQHHIHTNDIHDDPDIAGNTVLRLNPLQPLLHLHAVQHIYIFLLICFFGFSVIFTSLEHLITGKHKTNMSKMLNVYRVKEILYTLVFSIRWFFLPYYFKTANETYLNLFLGIAPMFMTGGFYLAFFFVISHNFMGVKMFNSKIQTEKQSQSTSFLYNQVVSSCNVGGSVLAFFNGGLNYQIEHHLFPRISHTHYYKIAPIVREYCKKKNIPYVHFNTIQENVTSCVQHLSQFGHEKNPYKEFQFW